MNRHAKHRVAKNGSVATESKHVFRSTLSVYMLFPLLSPSHPISPLLLFHRSLRDVNHLLKSVPLLRPTIHRNDSSSDSFCFVNDPDEPPPWLKPFLHVPALPAEQSCMLYDCDMSVVMQWVPSQQGCWKRTPLLGFSPLEARHDLDDSKPWIVEPQDLSPPVVLLFFYPSFVLLPPIRSAIVD